MRWGFTLSVIKVSEGHLLELMRRRGRKSANWPTNPPRRWAWPMGAGRWPLCGSLSFERACCSRYQPGTPSQGDQKGGLRHRKVRRKLKSTDPRRPAILASIRFLWKHLPDDGVLLFFDVKPVSEKAHGGARYTSAKRVVLPLRQKSVGSFIFLPSTR